MRLRDINNIISSEIGKLAVKSQAIQKTQNTKLLNIDYVNNALKRIKQTGVFKNLFVKVYSYDFLSDAIYGEIIVETNAFNAFTQNLNQLRSALTTFNNAIDDYLPDEHNFDVSIKLPNVTDLKDLKDNISQIDMLLEQLLVNEYIKGKASFLRLDAGTEWIDLVLDSVKSYTWLWSFVVGLVYLRREKRKNEDAIEDIRKKRQLNDLFKKLSDRAVEAYDKDANEYYDNLKSAQVEKMFKDAHLKTVDNEFRKRVKVSFDRGLKLLEQGVQFFPSSKAPDEIKNKIPDFTKPLNNMLPKLKELTEETEKKS